MITVLFSFCSALYQITHLGDDDEEPEFSSLMATELEEGETFFFHARDLQNLVLVDEMESLAPIMHCQVSLGKNCYIICNRLEFFFSLSFIPKIFLIFFRF